VRLIYVFSEINVWALA
jgi:hypothetical protein